jgi:hypothetical protein
VISDLRTNYRDWLFLALGCGLGWVGSYFASLFVVRQTEKKKILVVEVLGRNIWVETTPAMPFSICDSSGATINNVYALSARVWNKGSDAIFGSDISDQHPLSIAVEQ